MARPAPTSIADHFRRLPDPRVRRPRRHALDAILVITLCAVICGADDWVAIARFGRAKRKWFRGFLTTCRHESMSLMLESGEEMGTGPATRH